MEKSQQGNMRRCVLSPHRKPTVEDIYNLLKRIEKLTDELGYRLYRAREMHARCQAVIASEPVHQGMSNVRTNFEENKVPIFSTYDEYQKMVLRSYENISIVMTINGKVVFISQNVLPLLGHRPEDIVGKTLLDIILDEQKDEISQKIILHFPLANAVGRRIEFCCFVRKGNAYQNAQQQDADRGKCGEKEIYDHVKFILYLQDAYDESFVFFGNYGPNSRNIRSSTPKLLWEEKYYIVGTIFILRKPQESEHPTEIQSNVIVIDSDDDIPVKCRRLETQCKSNGLERICQNDSSNMKLPDSDSDVEIVAVFPAPRQRRRGTVQSRTSARLSTSSNISATTSKSTGSGQESMIDSKYKLEPVNMELEVPPEFLLKDCKEEEGSSKKEECRDEAQRRQLEEAKTSKSKECFIDEIIDREQERVYRLPHCIAELGNSPYELRQTGKGQEHQVYCPQAQVQEQPYCPQAQVQKQPYYPQVQVQKQPYCPQAQVQKLPYWPQAQVREQLYCPQAQVQKQPYCPQAQVQKQPYCPQAQVQKQPYCPQAQVHKQPYCPQAQVQKQPYWLQVQVQVQPYCPQAQVQEQPYCPQAQVQKQPYWPQAQVQERPYCSQVQVQKGPYCPQAQVKKQPYCPQAQVKKQPYCPQAQVQKQPYCSQAQVRKQPYCPQAQVQKQPYWPQAQVQKQPYCSQAQVQKQPYCPQVQEQEQPYCPQAQVQEQPYCPQAQVQEQPYWPQPQVQEQPYCPQAQVQKQPYWPQAQVQKQPYWPQAQVQEQSYWPQAQTVSVINDLWSRNDNAEHLQNQTQRHRGDPADCTPLLRPHPSTRSHQTMTVPRQPLATAGYPPAESQYSSARPQDPPTLSHHASSDYLRLTRQPGQDNAAYFLTEENTINPHP